jgi:ElaB/YqjD/DUF883 family membrane-anchored ribosome-binding protein
MNDETSSAPGMANDVRADETTPYAASRGLLRAAAQPAQETDQLAAFVRQQPLTAALVALAVGYVLGKIS